VNRITVRRFFRRVLNQLFTPYCRHRFRPAAVDGKPARYCDLCDRTDALTPSEYYQQFGERGWRWTAEI